MTPLEIIRQRRPGFQPQVAVVLGSGLGGLPDQMVDDQWMYAEGFDGVKEKALQYLQSKLGST